MKKLTITAFFFFVAFSCFADEIDQTLAKIGSDISDPFSDGAILCILDFDTPTREMSEYIQTQLTSLVLGGGVARRDARRHGQDR